MRALKLVYDSYCHKFLAHEIETDAQMNYSIYFLDGPSR